MAQRRPGFRESIIICLWAALGLLGLLFRWLSEKLEAGRDSLQALLPQEPDDDFHMLPESSAYVGANFGENILCHGLQQRVRVAQPRSAILTPLRPHEAVKAEVESSVPVDLEDHLYYPPVMPGQRRRYYAVAVGRKSGIYDTWYECNAQVHEYSKAIHKSFKSRAEAEEFIRIVQARITHGLHH